MSKNMLIPLAPVQIAIPALVHDAGETDHAALSGVHHRHNQQFNYPQRL